jgi:hypothetical protein
MSFEQLAQSAYAAYFKKAVEVDDEGLATHATPWAQMDPGTQECWVAVVKQLWAEFAAIH